MLDEPGKTVFTHIKGQSSIANNHNAWAVIVNWLTLSLTSLSRDKNERSVVLGEFEDRS